MKRAPSSSTSISRKNIAITLAGSVTGARQRPREDVCTGCSSAIAADDDSRDDHALDHRLVVALADVRPQPLVQPEQREHDHRDGHDPPRPSS